MFGSRRTRSTTVRTRRPSLISRFMHPQTTSTSTTTARHPTTTKPHHRAKRPRATGPAPLSTHRRARTKPTMGARIHGFAKRVMGTVTGNRGKKNAGVAMQKGLAPGTRRRRHI